MKVYARIGMGVEYESLFMQGLMYKYQSLVYISVSSMLTHPGSWNFLFAETRVAPLMT